MTNLFALFAMTDLFWYFLAAEIHEDITKYVCTDSFVMLGLQSMKTYWLSDANICLFSNRTLHLGLFLFLFWLFVL